MDSAEYLKRIFNYRHRSSVSSLMLEPVLVGEEKHGLTMLFGTRFADPKSVSPSRRLKRQMAFNWFPMLIDHAWAHPRQRSREICGAFRRLTFYVKTTLSIPFYCSIRTGNLVTRTGRSEILQLLEWTLSKLQRRKFAPVGPKRRLDARLAGKSRYSKTSHHS